MNSYPNAPHAIDSEHTKKKRPYLNTLMDLIIKINNNSLRLILSSVIVKNHKRYLALT